MDAGLDGRADAGAMIGERSLGAKADADEDENADGRVAEDAGADDGAMIGDLPRLGETGCSGVP